MAFCTRGLHFMHFLKDRIKSQTIFSLIFCKILICFENTKKNKNSQKVLILERVKVVGLKKIGT